MRRSISMQNCHIACDSGGRLVRSRCRYGYGLALGRLRSASQIEASRTYQWLRGKVTRQLAERKTNWTTDASITALSDEMYQAIPFLYWPASRSRIWHFFNTTFGASSTSVPNGLECNEMETLANRLLHYLRSRTRPDSRTYTRLTGRMPIPPPRFGRQFTINVRWSYEDLKR